MINAQQNINLSLTNVEYLCEQSSLFQYLSDDDICTLIHTSKTFALFFTKKRQTFLHKFYSEVAPQYKRKLQKDEYIEEDKFIFPLFIHPDSEFHCMGPWYSRSIWDERGSCYEVHLAKCKITQHNNLVVVKSCNVPYYFRAYAVDDKKSMACCRIFSESIALLKGDGKISVIEMPA